MKKPLIFLSAAALTGSLFLAGCGSNGPSTCAPMASGQIALQSFDLPLRGGGSGGGGGRSGGSYSSGGSRSSYGSSRSGGVTSGGSYGSSKSGGSRSYYSPSRPSSGYRPAPGTPHYTYVRQSNGQWLPFLGGVIAGAALDHAPAGCR